MRVYVLARTAMFIALGAVFKASLSMIPNVELVTFWVYVNTMLYGFAYGAFVGMASNVVADIFFTGAGPWTIFVSLAFALSALFFHVWSGRRISFLPFFLLALVSLAFLVFFIYTGAGILSRVVGWVFFALAMSAFLFHFAMKVCGRLSDFQKRILRVFLYMSFGVFLLFILQDFFSAEQGIVFFTLWFAFVMLRNHIGRLLSPLARKVFGKRATGLETLSHTLSRNQNLAWAALISTILWDLFTVVTMNVMLFGQPLGGALYAQYGIMPPTFYPFGIVHTVNNVIIITLLGKKTVDIITTAESHYA